MGRLKNIVSVTGPQRQHWVGNGFNVRQMFGYNDLGRGLSPFLLLDYAGPTDFKPALGERRGVGAHPHRGFETVTIVYRGGVEHRDSTGGYGKIGPGDVQWMTAGSGVLHEEMHSLEFNKTGGIFELVQLWVNLPKDLKMSPPRYQTLLNQEIPIGAIDGGAGQIRVIAGEFGGLKGPAKTHTPMNVWDLELKANMNLNFEVTAGETCVIFCRSGELLTSDSKRVVGPGLIILDKSGEAITLRTLSGVNLLYLGGPPIMEPMVGMGPFVMNTESEIEQAFRDYEAGRFGSL